MARPKGAKDIGPRPTKKQLEAWPEASQFVFDDWVLELLAELPKDDEEVYKDIPRHEGVGAPGNPIKIGEVIDSNAFRASKILGVSNSMVHKWLINGKAMRI
jgi:hypothetical protein